MIAARMAAAPPGLRPSEALRSALAAEAGTPTLSRTFFDDHVAVHLRREPVLEIRRLVPAEPAAVWSAAVGGAWVPSAGTPAAGRLTGSPPLRPGSRIRARGSIGGRIAAAYEVTVTRALEGETLSWTTRARPTWHWAAIETRWALTLEPADVGTQAGLVMWGIAFPPGIAARLAMKTYERVSGSMYQAMHRDLESLAAIAETTAR